MIAYAQVMVRVMVMWCDGLRSVFVVCGGVMWAVFDMYTVTRKRKWGWAMYKCKMAFIEDKGRGMCTWSRTIS